MMAFGAISDILTTLFYALLSVPLSLMRYSNDWVILLSRSKLSAILLIRRDFMFMPNDI